MISAEVYNIIATYGIFVGLSKHTHMPMEHWFMHILHSYLLFSCLLTLGTHILPKRQHTCSLYCVATTAGRFASIALHVYVCNISVSVCGLCGYVCRILCV